MATNRNSNGDPDSEVACPHCGGTLDSTGDLDVDDPDDDWFCPTCGNVFDDVEVGKE